MVEIKIDNPDPTLDAMRKAMEVKSMREPKRSYLGASLIGRECARQIYYNYNGYPKEPFKSSTLMAFESGHTAEDITADRLRMVDGVILHTHKHDGSQYGFKEEYENGVFAGHIDGVIEGLLQAPKTPHIWEHKDCKESKFKEFIKLKEKHGEKNVLKHWNMTYYVQHQIYMHKMGLSRGYMTVSLAGCRDYNSCRTEYSKDVALEYIDRAKKIINATQEPTRLSENSDFWICNMCDYKDICHE